MGDIINYICREFSITINYTKAYVAKDFAYGLIHGKPLESYVKLPSYCRFLEVQNLDTLTFIHAINDQRFKYFLWLWNMYTWISHFNLIIFVDDTFFTSRLKFTLFIATYHNANF